jgi:hypothetical protein
MARWGITPISFNGVALSDTEREALFLAGQGVHHSAGFNPITVERIGRFPSFSRSQPVGMKPFPISFVMRDLSEMARQKLFDLFEPSNETRLLVVHDGSGMSKQVSCIAQGVRRERGYWVAPLLAPDPSLESTALKSRSLTLTGATAVFSPDPDNVGDLKAPPVLKVTVNQPRWTRGGFRFVDEITYANRSPLALQGPGTGTWLLRITNSSSAANIKVTSNPAPVTLAAGFSSGASPPFTISAVEAISGFEDQGMLVIKNGSGQEEQFEYDSKNNGARTFNCVKRALGGTLQRTFAAADPAWQSHMLYNCADLAVFVDGVPLPAERVTVVNPNTAATPVWVELTDRPAVEGRLRVAIVPTDTMIELRSRDHGFVVGDWAVLKDDIGGGSEVVRITAVTGAELTVQRGLRNTTALSVPAGQYLYRQGHHIQLAYGYSGAVTGEFNYLNTDSSHPRLPLIDLVNSNNAEWRWTTVPMWPSADAPRPGGLMRQRVGANRNQASVTLYGGDATYPAWFEDADPTASKPNYDRLEFVSALAISQFSFDAEMAWPLLLEIRALEIDGPERLLARLHGHDVGEGSSYHRLPDAYTDKSYSLSPSVQGFALHVRQCVVAGAETDDVLENMELPSGSLPGEGQSLDLTEDTELLGLVVRLTSDGAGTNKLAQVSLFTFDGQNPLLGRETLTPAGWSIAAAHMLTTSAHFCMFPTFATKTVLPAGSYFLRLRRDPTGPATGGTLYTARNAQPIYPRGSRWEADGSVWVQQPQHDLWFAVLSPTADNEEGSPSATGEILKLGDVRVVFAVDEQPLMVRRGEELARYLDTVWSRGSPVAQQMRVRWLVRAADVAQVTIDVAEKTVIEGKFNESIRFGLSSVRDDDWLSIVPTADAPGFEDLIAVTAVSGVGGDIALAVSEAHTIEWRDRWQL